jgi:hypothetical protein
MKMPYEKLRFCMLCAYLHDVGKILTPSEILQKKDKLTDDEYEVMKLHPVYSYDICMRYEKFRDVAPIVRSHHESIDGSGYPDGLKGADIPFEASLIKIADVYDALTRKRQYKDGFKQSATVRILIEEAKKNKICAGILIYLVNSILEELVNQEKEQTNIVRTNKEELEILKELDDIYKQIYDRGNIEKLEKKLLKFELPSGYDMRTNASLLINKQKIIENEEKVLIDIHQEIEDIDNQYDELEMKPGQTVERFKVIYGMPFSHSDTESPRMVRR